MLVKMSENDLRKQMYAGFYSDIELTKPTGTITNELKEKEREIEGITKNTKNRTSIHNSRMPR